MLEQHSWMQALGHLRDDGLAYDDIAVEVGASSRSVRRWDQYRVRVLQGGAPMPEREAVPISAFATALINLVK
jgi:hypothetical protein